MGGSLADTRAFVLLSSLLFDNVDDLKTMFTLIAILSHGNAKVEREFSVNRECLPDISEEVNFRTVYDAI